MKREAEIAKRMVSRIAEMTREEVEDWKDALETLESRLEDMAGEVGEGDFSDLDAVAKWVKQVEREQINLDDEVLNREVSEILGEVARVLNEAEGLRRWWEDETRKRDQKCEMVKGRAEGLAKKIKGLEGRI